MSAAEDQERARKANAELANAYREMMGTFAWKHLNANIFEMIRQESLKQFDDLPSELVSVASAAELRGIRKCLGRIATEIGYILDGKPF